MGGPGNESNRSFNSAPAPDPTDGRVTHIDASNFGLAAIVGS